MYSQYLSLALKEANKASKAFEIPVGAVLISPDGKIYKGQNRKIRNKDPTSHAEIVCIRKAKEQRLDNHTLITTLEPCPMCISACREARISKIIFGLKGEKYGACGSNINLHQKITTLPDIEIIQNTTYNEEIKEMMQNFFKQLRNKK